MSWKTNLRKNITAIDQLDPRLIDDREAQTKMVDTHPMSIPEYYYNLIDPNDPHDPIKKLAIPEALEMSGAGDYDTSGESENTIMQGLQHKYQSTVLILVTNACFMYCRHCFRKRFVGLSNAEVNNRADEAIVYIRDHQEVSNVLLTGGDSFMLSNGQIEKYLKALSEISHLDFIRFGTRATVVMPERISGDPELLDLLETYNKKKRIYVVTHYNHPKELTEESLAAISALQARDIKVLNQSVLLKGVNTDPEVIVELMRKLTRAGIQPYYMFQCRPVKAVKETFEIPLSEGYDIIKEAKASLSGPAKHFRFAMSHPRGKIEMVGKTEDQMIFRFIQAKSPEDIGKTFIKDIDPLGCWFDRDLNWLE